MVFTNYFGRIAEGLWYDIYPLENGIKTIESHPSYEINKIQH